MMIFFPANSQLTGEEALLLLLVLVLVFRHASVAQSTGSLRGQVLDPSGAVVPGASVTLTQGAYRAKRPVRQ